MIVIAQVHEFSTLALVGQWRQNHFDHGRIREFDDISSSGSCRLFRCLEWSEPDCDSTGNSVPPCRRRVSNAVGQSGPLLRLGVALVCVGFPFFLAVRRGPRSRCVGSRLKPALGSELILLSFAGDRSVGGVAA